MKTSTLYIVGSFYDQPSRILSYATVASSLGVTPRFIGEVTDVNYSNLTAEQFVFTDETTICAAHAALSINKDNQALERKLTALMQLSDKVRARQLTSHAFPHEYFVVRSEADLKSIPKLEERWLCKPRWGSNSRDVQEISNSCGLRKAIEPITARNNHALIERYIEGSHICIDFAWNGTELALIGYCEKRMTDFGRKIVEAFHTLSDDTLRYAKLAREKLLPLFLESFSDVSFTIHGEFIVEDATGDLRIAELNPRAPWGMLPELFSIGNGINFDHAVIANALGQSVPTVSCSQPVVLGSIFTEGFFSNHETVPDQGNTLFIERFDQPEGDEPGENKLTKYGRFMLWGTSQEAVEKEWNDLAAIAVPEEVRLAGKLDTSDTWKSKCC